MPETPESATTQFTIGAEVSCSDEVCGKVTRVIVDPVARALTHLVVEPKHGGGPARLVPLDLVNATAGAIELRCTAAQFDKLNAAEETRFLPGASGYPGYDQGQALSWPYYAMGGMGGMGMMGGMGVGMGGIGPQAVTTDTIPVGEVDVHRGEHVQATDGDIGRVQGLVIDPRNRHVTHVLLQEGHLWGRKNVSIPIGAVTRVDDGIRLNITKEQVEDLPAIDINQPSE
jgi:sporulation protein YlmC with PRC-barrel domain